MTLTLTKAIQTVKALPDAEQDRIAQIILYEADVEKRWQESVEAGADMRAEMAAEAEAEYHAGRTWII